MVDLGHEDLLVMGIDTSMVKDVKGRKVFSAVFANLEPMHCDENNKRTGGFYFYNSREHPSGETVGIAKTYFESALLEYEIKVKKLPQKIVIYRDGINDGDVSILNYSLKTQFEL